MDFYVCVELFLLLEALSAFLPWTLEVGAVNPRQMSSQARETEKFRRAANMARMFRGRFLERFVSFLLKSRRKNYMFHSFSFVPFLDSFPVWVLSPSLVQPAAVWTRGGF